MAQQVTNRIASPALRGQAIKISLDQTETIADLPLLTVGMTVGIVSSGFTGKICSVDSLGTSFLATPDSPAGNLSSGSTPGILSAGELINID